MCVIVGYTGYRRAAALVLDALKRLEYMGCDSSGIMSFEAGQLQIRRSMGKVEEFEGKENPRALEGNTAVGHNRWATHGAPSVENAHPHTDCTGRFAVVHNGIIENHEELRTGLLERGHNFTSQTDTEVIPHLLEELYAGDLATALRQTVNRLKGSFALVAVSAQEPEKLFAVGRNSRLVIGVGEGESFIASDISAFLDYTKEILVLERDEMAILQQGEVKIIDPRGKPVQKKIAHVEWDVERAEKGGYDHYMLKEIYDQPQALLDTMGTRLLDDRVVLEDVRLTAPEVQSIERIFIVACGTAYHAGLMGRSVLEELVGIPVEVSLASEFCYENPFVTKDSLAIVISQSGTTADTLVALRECRGKGARILAITNVVGSTVAQEADDLIYTRAGLEVSVPSTKGYTSQLVALVMLALDLGLKRGTISRSEAREIIKYLRLLPKQVETILEQDADIKEIVLKYADNAHAFYMGRGLDYAVAMEGALKLKETSYIHAEAYPAGELKHGALALVTEGTPIVAVVTQPHIFERTLSNIQEVKTRGAAVLAISTTDQGEIKDLPQDIIVIPTTHKLLLPVLAVIPLQLLAYHVAIKRGCNVDSPRNLAKSITVE